MYPCCPSTISPTQIVGPLADIRGALVGTEFIYSLKRASDQSQETLQSAQPTRVNTISFWKPADSTRSRSGGGSAPHPLIVHGYGFPPPLHQWWLRRHSRVRGFNKPRWGPDGLFGSIRTGARSRARGQWVTPHSCTVQWAPPELKGSVGAPTLGSRPDALAHGNKRGWGAFPLTPSNQRKIRSGRRGRSIRDIPLDRRDKWECSKPLQPIKGGLMSTWIGAGQLHKVRRGRVRAL